MAKIKAKYINYDSTLEASSDNIKVTNPVVAETDGFSISAGTTPRQLTLTGADITLTGSGTNTYTYPTASDTLVGRTSTDTLTNKTLTSPKINEDVVLTSTSTELNLLSGITVLSGSNTGDQDLSGLLPLTGGTLTNTLTIDQNNDSIGLYIDSAATTNTKYALALNAAGGCRLFQAVQSGNEQILNLNKIGTGAGNVINLVNAGTGNGLFIDQNGSTADATLGGALTIDNSGNERIGLNVYSNHALPLRELVRFRIDNTTATQNVAAILNDGTGDSLFIDQNGNGDSIFIDTEMTTAYGLRIDADVATTGQAGYFYSNSASYSGTNGLVRMRLDHASASGTLLVLDNDGTGSTLVCNGNEIVDSDGNLVVSGGGSNYTYSASDAIQASGTAYTTITSSTFTASAGDILHSISTMVNIATSDNYSAWILLIKVTGSTLGTYYLVKDEYLQGFYWTTTSPALGTYSDNNLNTKKELALGTTDILVLTGESITVSLEHKMQYSGTYYSRIDSRRFSFMVSPSTAL